MDVSVHLALRGLAGAADRGGAAALHREGDAALGEALAGERKSLRQLQRLAVELQECGLGLRIERHFEACAVLAFVMKIRLRLSRRSAGRSILYLAEIAVRIGVVGGLSWYALSHRLFLLLVPSSRDNQFTDQQADAFDPLVGDAAALGVAQQKPAIGRQPE